MSEQEAAEDTLGDIMVASLRDGLRKIFGPVNSVQSLKDDEIAAVVSLVDKAITSRVADGHMLRGPEHLQ